MTIKVVNQANAEKLAIGVDAWKLQSLASSELILIVLKPEECIEPHINSYDVVFYVLDGEGTLAVDNDKVLARRGDTIALDKNLLRAWYNTGEKELRLLVFKSLI